MTPKLIRVLIVAASMTMRNFIADSLSSVDGIHVVGAVSSGEQALAVVTGGMESPDVVLLDLSMRGMGAIATIRALHGEPHSAKVIVLVSSQDGSVVEAALQAGADYYLSSSDLESDTLYRAVFFAHTGMRLPVPTSAPAAPKVPTWGFLPLPNGNCLTHGEHQLLRLLVQGLSNRDIAEQMVINTISVRFLMRSVFRKLGTKTRTEAVEYTLSNHLLPEG